MQQMRKRCRQRSPIMTGDLRLRSRIATPDGSPFCNANHLAVFFPGGEDDPQLGRLPVGGESSGPNVKLSGTRRLPNSLVDVHTGATAGTSRRHALRPRSR